MRSTTALLLGLAAAALAGPACTEIGDPWYRELASGSGGDGGGGGGVVHPTFEEVKTLFDDAGCFACHSASLKLSGLDVSSIDGLLTGGVQGPSLVPCEPDQSVLVDKIANDPPAVGVRMPQIGAFLTDAQIATVRQWVADGARETYDATACDTAPPEIVSWADDIQPLFAKHGCTGADCHGAAKKSGLDLTTIAGVYAGGEQYQRSIVTPCDADNSVIIEKVTDKPTEGVPMPFERPMLSNADVNLLKAWINQGAEETYDPETCGGEPLPEPVAYSAVQAVFVEYTCNGCHGGSSGLTVTTLEGLLAGGSQFPGEAVIPCDGEGSVLVKKMRGDATVGSRMPLGAVSGPSEDDIQLIVDWIDQGANETYDPDACN